MGPWNLLVGALLGLLVATWLWVDIWPAWQRPVLPAEAPTPQGGQVPRPSEVRVLTLRAPTTVVPACHPGEPVAYRLLELPWRVTIAYPVCADPAPFQSIQITFSAAHPVWLAWDGRYQSAGLDLPTWLDGGGLTTLAFWWDERQQAWTLVASSAAPSSQRLPCDHCTDL